MLQNQQAAAIWPISYFVDCTLALKLTVQLSACTEWKYLKLLFSGPVYCTLIWLLLLLLLLKVHYIYVVKDDVLSNGISY